MSLLFLLSLVLHVSCLEFGSLPPRPTTGVRLFLGEENVTIANFSMIAAGLIHDFDIDGPGNGVGVTGSSDGQNDGLWCQSSLNQNMIGTWYYPNGATVSDSYGYNSGPMYASNSATGQIGLLRKKGIASVQGLYSCVIPNEEGINQTLYVAAYGNTDFLKDGELPMIDGSGPSFQLLSSVDADPPVFSLSFNVTNRSPTIVTCSVDNGNQFNVSENDLIRTVTPVNNDVQVQVSVIFRMRVSGLYKCSVTTDRITTAPLVSTNMAMRNVSVTGSPSNLTYSRISLLSVTLGWSPSAVISATPQYHVFVNNSNGIIMNDNATNTELSLSLRPDDEYNIRLVHNVIIAFKFIFSTLYVGTILPFAATSVTTIPGTTSANISFIIPKTSYANENYSISYTGQQFQATQAVSVTRMSSSSVDKPIMIYIVLTGLEEDNVYQFTIDSSNCLGTTHTGVMNFTTLPALPAGYPMNCINTTFLPLSITITWTGPALIEQNGAPVGYNLTCMNTNGVSVNGLSPTRSSTDTMFTITDVMPFTGYTCELSFINVVGEGPSTQCTFETAQSVDSPRNFTSIPDQYSILFSWIEPAITHGIIIRYNLTVTNLDESKSMSFIIKVNPDQRFIHHNVNGFGPYQNYTASVSASTIIGAGPVATTAGRTLPDIPSSPHLVVSPVVIDGLTVAYTVAVLNETTINITWSPPSHPNGEITGFIVRIATDAITSSNKSSPLSTLGSNNVSFVPGKASYFLIFGGLKAKVPYYVSVVAVNQVGEGNPATAIVFTKADSSVTVSPSNLQAMRIRDRIVLSWDPVTLEEAKGFFVYSITLTPDDGSTSSTLRQTNTRTISVAYDTTSVNITDTEPQLAYTVSISVLLLSDVGLIEGPEFNTSLAMSPTDVNNTDDGSVLLVAVIVSIALIMIFSVLVFISIVVLYRKKYNGVRVAPDVSNTSTTQNDEELYDFEMIDDDQYELINIYNDIVQQEQDTPIVGDSLANIAFPDSPAYVANPITASSYSPMQ
ncbi:PREDICTED: phosphatidylinositol phosphatase PTPRQ-like [Amphimedon queenslandica]|uniref:Fibronectin type-III domain-containing protein n=1 Tax=Amphimedon queenslandica TaxID=400682 RepID=A0AAN0J347_AMPQE|nr:PREDICTED: phosphatidylinositol phosphatase PTPRQ-like [Amphimedon queenslandica]|eukprot:XP_019851146.1 PREDICTED: phosphatidylinositol phosphatase PTPRQ-like [Amphimedon queenslandica]